MEPSAYITVSGKMGVLKLEKPETADKVTFLWNDVAVVADDNCSFVVCKSLVKLSPELPGIGVVEKIEADSVTRRIVPSAEGGQEIDGEVAVKLSYATAEEEAASAEFAVPFRGEYAGSWERSNKPQVVYLDGQSAGFDHVLLETVLAIPHGSVLLRAEQTAVAHFRQEQRLELAEAWPDWAQLIGTQLSYELQNIKVQEDTLLLEGEQQIRLLYAANQAQGEKVMYYPLTLPFSMKLSPEQKITEEAELSLGYQSLTAHLLNERQVAIDVSGVVRAAGLLADERQSQEAAIEQDKDALQDAAPESRPIAVQPPEAETAPVMEAKEPMQPQPPSQMPHNMGRPRRPSKRDNLLKYMRTLDRGVKTPQCSRNIALGQEEAADNQAEETLKQD